MSKLALAVGVEAGKRQIARETIVHILTLSHFRHFSTSVASEKSRKTFASNIKKLYNEFNLDGVDIDWEFPGQQGEGKNKVSPDDTANFLVFLKLLRETLPHKARITAAVQTVPFADSNGKPSRNVAGFAEVLDYVLLMNYDTWGCMWNLLQQCGSYSSPILMLLSPQHHLTQDLMLHWIMDATTPHNPTPTQKQPFAPGPRQASLHPNWYSVSQHTVISIRRAPCTSILVILAVHFR